VYAPSVELREALGQTIDYTVAHSRAAEGV